MADRFRFILPGGRLVTTNDPATAISLRYGSGATEAPRSEKVDAAVEEAKAENIDADAADPAAGPAAKKSAKKS